MRRTSRTVSSRLSTRCIAGFAALALLTGCAGPDGPEGRIEPIAASEQVAGEVDGAVERRTPQVAPGPEREPAPEPEPEPALERIRASRDAGSTSAAIDTAVIPDEITVEYVDAVLVELEELYAEAAREAASSGELTLAVSDRLNSVFADELVDRRRADFAALLAMERGFRAAGDIEPTYLRVEEVLDHAPGCLYVVGSSELSSMFLDGPGVRTTFALLVEKGSRLFVDLNPTPWVYRQIGVGDEDELREERPC